MTTVESLQVRAMDKPDDTQEFPLVKIDATNIGGMQIIRVVAQPGWRWSTSVGPVVGATSCPAPHTGYIVSGALHLRMDDGTESELVAGDAFTCAAGHDGWVVGSDPLEFLEVAAAG